MRRSRMILAGVAAFFAAALALSLVAPREAHAWTITGSDRRLRVERESGDSTGTVKVYVSGLKVANMSDLTAGTWDTVPPTPQWTILFDANDRVVEVYMANYTSALVTTPDGDNAVWALSRMPVYLVDPASGAFPYNQPVSATVPLPVSVEGTVPVSNTASVSVAGTLPVAVESFLGEDDGPLFWALAGGLFGFGAFGLVASYVGMRRSERV